MAIYNYDAIWTFKMFTFDILTTNFVESKHQTRIRTMAIYNYDAKWNFKMIDFDILTTNFEQSKHQNLCGGGHVCTW